MNNLYKNYIHAYRLPVPIWVRVWNDIITTVDVNYRNNFFFWFCHRHCIYLYGYIYIRIWCLCFSPLGFAANVMCVLLALFVFPREPNKRKQCDKSTDASMTSSKLFLLQTILKSIQYLYIWLLLPR